MEDVSDAREIEKLYEKYRDDGEKALRGMRDERLRHLEDASAELEEKRRCYRTAEAAVYSVERLIREMYSPSTTCGKVNNLISIPGPSPPRALKTPDDAEYDHHPGYWRREETDVLAITVEEEEVLQVSEQASLGELRERAAAKGKQFEKELSSARAQVDQLEVEFNRCESFLRKVITGEIEEMMGENAVETFQDSDQAPSLVEGPPEDLFEGSGTKNRTKAKGYARDLAKFFTDKDADMPSQWTDLHTKVGGQTKVEGQVTGRNKVQRVRDAFKNHPDVEEPPDPDSLCKACYHYFYPDVSFG